MACNIVKDNAGKVVEVYANDGNPSALFEFIKQIVVDPTASYASYLELQTKAESGEIQAVMNNQGEVNPALTPDAVRLITKAAQNVGEYEAAVHELSHEYKKDKLGEALHNFLETVGVKVEVTSQIKDKTGQVLPVVGQARLLDRVIRLANSEATTDALAEEAAHFITAMLQTDDHPLYRSMMSQIEGYAEFAEIMDPNGFYYKKYEGDVELLKREAIGKVIARHIMGNETDVEATELDPAKLSRLNRWWQKVLALLNKVFGTAGNPFSKTARILMDNRLADVMQADPATMVLPDEIFYKASSATAEATPLERVEADQSKWEAVPVPVGDDPYFKKLAGVGETTVMRYRNSVTGEVLFKRMSDEGSLKYSSTERYYSDEQKEKYDRWSEIHTTSGNRVHETMERLINFHAGNSKISPAEIEREYSEYGANFKKLNAYAKKLVADIKAIQKEKDPKGKVHIRTEMFVLNRAKKMGGTIDLLAFFSDGSAAIFDYKSKIAQTHTGYAYRDKKTGKVVLRKDVWLENAETYDLQMGSYVHTLLSEYGVTEVVRSRVVPIMLDYKRDSNNMPTKIVNDIQLETDDNQYIQQLALAHETTGFARLDKLIRKEGDRLTILISQQKDANYAERQRLQERINASRRIIRDLQVSKSANAVIREVSQTLKVIEKGLNTNKEYLKNGDPNPDYMSAAELNNAYQDLKHFSKFTTLTDIIKSLEKKDKDAAARLSKDLEVLNADIARKQESLVEKMMERLDVSASNKGVRGITEFNKEVGKLTADWVSRSGQSHPALRLIHNFKAEIEGHLVRIEKELATEIESKTNALFEWGSANGYPGASVYDVLINPNTRNLYARFNEKYTEDRKKAFEDQDIKWLQQYFEVDQELLDKEYKNWRANQIKLLKEKGGSVKTQASRLAKWETRFNPKHETAWYNPTNPFLKASKDNNKMGKYLSPEYMKIQNSPVLKDFYDYHIKKTSEFLRLMGVDKKYNYVADIHKNMIDQFLQDGFDMGKMKQAWLDKFQLKEHDKQFGMVGLDGEFLRSIPRFHVTPLKNSQDKYDSSLKSKELGKNLYLLGSAAHMYSYLNDITPTLLMMESLFKDSHIEEATQDKLGDIILDSIGRAKGEATRTNAGTITEFINAEFFGQSLVTKDKTFGKNLSVNKTILVAKNYHTIATLGLKSPVAVGALGAGFMGLEMQASKGLYLTRSNLRAAQKAYFSRDPKLRAVFEYFQLTLEDLSTRRADMLSSTTRAKYMTADRWFEFLARADRTLDAVLAAGMAMNYGINPKTKKLELLKDLPEGTESIWDTIEIEENPTWERTGTQDRYLTKIPEVENLKENNRNWVSFKQKVHKIGSKVKGAVPKEDRFNSQNKLINRLFIHYRSWLPGIAIERFGNLRYDYIMENFDQGTWKTMWGNIGADAQFDSFGQVVDTETWMHIFTTDALTDLAKIGVDIGTFGLTNAYKIKDNRARLEFEKFIENEKGNPEFDFKNEAEKEVSFEKFLDFKRANIRGALMELRAVFLLIGLMLALGGDWDDDDKVDLKQSWAGRKLLSVVNRIYRETAVFYDPTEMTGPRASGIPLISLAQQGLKWASNSMDEMRDGLFGEDSAQDRTGPGYYTWKFLPGLSGIVRAAEIYPQDKIVR
tara:strand:+ start:19168 stop:24069 length:4902 start_codon:yes stop_codon:yes gene_type:complete